MFPPADAQEHDMTPFQKFLEAQGFQPDACESCTHPDFYALAESMHAALVEIGCRVDHGNQPEPCPICQVVDRIIK